MDEISFQSISHQDAISIIEKNLFSNRTLAAGAIRKFASLQAVSPNLHYKSLLSLAILAKQQDIEISELNTFAGWQEKDKRIGTLNDGTVLYTRKSVQLSSGNYGLTELQIFDFSQTNAAQFGYKPKNDRSLLFPKDDTNNQKIFLESLISHLNTKNFVIKQDLLNTFDMEKNLLTIDRNQSPQKAISFILETIVQNKTLSPDDYRANSPEHDRISFMSFQEQEELRKVISTTIIDKLGVPTQKEIDTLQFIAGFEDKISIISKSLNKLESIINLDDFIDKIHKEKVSIKPKNQYKIDFRRISDEEFEQLKEKGLQLIKSSNPEPILSAIGANYEPKNNKIKILSIDGESTKTTDFFLDKGKWLFKRFGGAGQGGDIVQFVRLETNLSYADAIEKCFEALNIKNPVTEAIESIKRENAEKLKNAGIEVDGLSPSTTTPKNDSIEKILQENKKRNEELRLKNEEIESKTSYNSRVFEASSTLTPDLREMMNQRGLTKLPKEALMLTLEYKKEDGTTYKRKGVGVLSGSEEDLKNIHDIIAKKGYCKINETFEEVTIGGDIHFPKYESKKGEIKKTASAGPKSTATFVNNNGSASKKAAIFESKNDYFAACQTRDFTRDKTDVYIANGIGQSKNIAAKIKEKSYGEIDLYTQFDIPAIGFAKKCLSEYRGKLNSFTYSSKEFNKDPNDILLSHPNQKLEARLKTFRNQNEAIHNLIELAEEHIDSLKDPNEKKELSEQLEKTLKSNNIQFLKQTSLDLK